MPSTGPSPLQNRGWTRRGLLAGGAAALGGAAGCSSLVEPRTDDRAESGPLTVQVPPELFDAIHLATGVWNANPSPVGDDVVWSKLGTRPAFEERVANHFAREAAVAVDGGRSAPPFGVEVALGEPPETADSILDATVDVGGIDSSYTPAGPDPERYFGDRIDEIYFHHVGREGWVFIISPALAEAGIDALTPEQIASVYQGEVTSWQAFGGPDQEPFVFLGADVTGVDPAYESFLRENDAVPEALDARYGQADEFVTAAAERDNALGVVQARGVRIARDRGVPTLDVLVDTERRTVYNEGYPMTDDVYLYTLGEPDTQERAFLDLLSSPFGQHALVARELLPVEPLAKS